MFVSTATYPGRRCGRCGQLKPISEFAWRRTHRGQRDNYCRDCRAEYKREHYERHRDRYISQAVRRKEALAAERAEYVVDFLSKRSCVDCGERDPLVLEFDHLANKKFNIAKGLRNRSWQAIVDEIAKCDVVCANCHRRRTALRVRSARAVVIQRRGLSASRQP